MIEDLQLERVSNEGHEDEESPETVKVDERTEGPVSEIQGPGPPDGELQRFGARRYTSTPRQSDVSLLRRRAFPGSFWCLPTEAGKPRLGKFPTLPRQPW